jgi:hypothetical protein
MYLYYDRISKTFTLETEESVEFLGPMTHALVKLREKGLTCSQAREAALQAVFNMGAPVNLDWIRKVATTDSAFFSIAC